MLVAIFGLWLLGFAKGAKNTLVEWIAFGVVCTNLLDIFLFENGSAGFGGPYNVTFFIALAIAMSIAIVMTIITYKFGQYCGKKYLDTR